MKVVCLFPITNNAENYVQILTTYRDKIIPKLKSLGAISQEIKFPGTDYVYVPTNKEIIGRPKGKGILESLKNVSEKPDVVLLCDGSGAIPYEGIVQIFQELVSDSSIYCVMANRTGAKAIGNLRYLIERFEIFSLVKYHKHAGNIKDGQCGLWGYRYGEINHDGVTCQIHLCAEGYEVELDLISEVLTHNLNYSFIDIELPPRKAHSSFIHKNNLEKIKFLMKKHANFDQLLSKYIQEFEISREYAELIDETIKNGWNNYKKDLQLMLSNTMP